MEQSECPVCGSAFLADLAGAANGRHRAGAHGGLRWPAARGPRLALAGLVAAVIAVGLPLLLAVLG
jgi:transposase